MFKKIGVALALFLILVLVFSEFEALLSNTAHFDFSNFNIIQPIILVIVSILPVLAIGSVVLLELSLLKNGEIKKKSTTVFRKILLVLSWIIAIDIISLSSINVYLMLLSGKCPHSDIWLYTLSNVVGIIVIILSIIFGNEANKK